MNVKEETRKKLLDPNISLKEKLSETSFQSDADRAIAQYILAHTSEIQNMSAESLANACYVGQGTIVRFARRFGYSGYKEFKNDLIRQTESAKYVNKKVDYNVPFDHKTAASVEIISSLSSLYHESVDVIREFADPSLLQEIAGEMKKSRRIYIYAVGDSLLTCMQFANRAAKVGYPVILPSQYGDLITITTHASEQDMALFVSYSGEPSFGFQDCLQILKQKRSMIYAMTSNRESYLAKYADRTLLIRKREGGRNERIGTFYSQFVFEFLLNVIYSILYVNQ